MTRYGGRFPEEVEARDRAYQNGYADGYAAGSKEVADLRRALETIQAWDCLNPPCTDQLADLAWLRRLVDEALSTHQGKGKTV